MQNQNKKARPAHRPRRALIIEDDLQSQNTCRRQLLREGYQVHTADSARQGVWKARRLKPDVILVDLLVRAGREGDVAALLRRDPLTRRIPQAYILSWQVGGRPVPPETGPKRPPKALPKNAN